MPLYKLWNFCQVVTVDAGMIQLLQEGTTFPDLGQRQNQKYTKYLSRVLRTEWVMHSGQVCSFQLRMQICL